MTAVPDWATAVPAISAVHNQPAPSYQWQGMSQDQLNVLRTNLVESILQVVVGLVQGILLPGPAGPQLATWAEQITSAFLGLNLSQPGAVAAAIEQAITQFSGGVQQVITALIGGTTGATSNSNDPLSIIFGFLKQAETVPADLWQMLFGQQATQQAQITALQNNSGTSLSDNFATAPVSGYTNLVGTLAVSTLGPYLQTASEAIAYRNTGPATNKHGAHIALGGVQRGVCRVGICADTAASSWAGLEIYCGWEGDAVRMITAASPTLTVVQQQADLLGTARLTNQDTFDVWYEPTPNTFHVIRNGLSVFDWVDSGNIVTHNTSHQKILVTTNGLNDHGFYGPGIAKLVGYDK